MLFRHRRRLSDDVGEGVAQKLSARNRGGLVMRPNGDQDISMANREPRRRVKHNVKQTLLKDKHELLTVNNNGHSNT